MRDSAGFLKHVGKTVLVSSHEFDADALATALVLKKALGRRRVFICTNGRPPFLAKNLARKAGVKLFEDWDRPIDSLILVDTSSDLPLEKYDKFARTRLLIDHHSSCTPDFLKKFDAVIFDGKSPACAQLAYYALRPRLDAKTAMVFLSALFVETVGFRIANAETFRLAAFLAEEYGLDVKKIGGEVLFETPPGFSEAKLKAVQRAVFEKHAGFTIARSKVDRFQNASAQTLVGLGADFAIVGGKSDGGAKISARASPRGEQALHLGKLMAAIGRLLGGDGGGHAAAAGAGGPRTKLLDDALQECMRRTRLAVEKKGFLKKQN